MSEESPKRYQSLDDFETLRVLSQNLREGIYITDARGRILDSNPAFLEIFGVSSLAELEQYSAADLQADPERRDLEMRLIERDGAVREFELEIRRPDGQLRTVLDTTYKVRDPETRETCYHGILVDITRRKELENQLREQSVRDALTGCYNRRYLFDLGERVGAEAEEWGCLFIDVDHFKVYNDRHGHQAGDLVLVEMSRFLMRQVRAEEPVIRLGGDEFLILFIGDNAARTEQVASRLQSTAAHDAPVAFSIGSAVRLPNESFQDTVHRADQKLIHVRAVSRSGDWPTFERRIVKAG
jgi:diguanylate cyclase (GGDEF)-like protein/PAS domain S-box-containing protein